MRTPADCHNFRCNYQSETVCLSKIILLLCHSPTITKALNFYLNHCCALCRVLFSCPCQAKKSSSSEAKKDSSDDEKEKAKKDDSSDDEKEKAPKEDSSDDEKEKAKKDSSDDEKEKAKKDSSDEEGTFGFVWQHPVQALAWAYTT